MLALIVSGVTTSDGATDHRSYTDSPTYSVPSYPSFPGPAPLGSGFGATPPGLLSIGIGDCVWNKHAPIGVDDDAPELEAVPCTDPRAEAEVLGSIRIGDGETYCEQQHPDYDLLYTVRSVGGGSPTNRLTLCLRQLP